MTIDEFNSTSWHPGMRAKYKDEAESYPIVSCDFEEALVAIIGRTYGADDPDWVRCENITLV